MMQKLLLILCLCSHQLAHAELPKTELPGTTLPGTVSAALQRVGLPADSVSVYVQALAAQPAQLNPPLLAHQSTISLNPASTMKLLTSYAGLVLLGPGYRWKTEVYTDGSLHNGVLDGNLYLKGFGDPNLMTVDFWRLLNSLRQLGVQEIKGDLIVDNSYFAATKQSLDSFDGDAARAYNATPSALAINLKAISFRFDSDASHVNITPEPNLPEIKVNNLLKIGRADCANWRNTLSYDVKQTGDTATVVTFSGVYASNCSEKYLELLAIDENNYTLHLFRKLWLELGGGFNGKLRTQNIPSNAVKLMQQDSKTLAQILVDINKWSNNLMARQLLLTIAAEKMGAPATEANGALAVNRWLNSLGLNFNELVIDNGSGLSRIERLSAQHMGELLVSAYYSPVMPELMSSLPILAVDGTLLKRMNGSQLQGRVHLKTGTINGVFTLAGYLLGQHGQRYVVVFMVNHAKAALTKPAQDALLEWVYAQ
jgi:D-alanyl-D-alanine carboxypeptidase/D-alanyl-D-alanine-endopeptidase (penicillin-binding protein 4)